MKALDLFAGSGWGIACQVLGIEEYGVEIMPEAVATRSANGMRTIFNDVWHGLMQPAVYMPPGYDILIASPPCQTFSVAGKGNGRAALDTVVGLIGRIESGMTAEDLRYGLHLEDDRTALVLTPLLYALRDKPEYIAWEQVPSVLPVWGRCADTLRGRGYSVYAGILNAEDYGVPQSRKRAVLIARKLGRASEPPKLGAIRTLADIRPDQEGLVSNYSTTGKGGIVRPNNRLPRGYRKINEPSHTITSKALNMKWLPAEENLTLREAASIQSYPEQFDLTHCTPLQIGNAVPPKMAEAILKTFLD